MALQQNTDRIQTTHIGSLPRPHRLLDAMKAKYSGQPHDPTAFQQALRVAVADVVRKQIDCGIDIVTDGEFSKPGFFTYIRERLEGFESRPNVKIKLFEQEVAAFPEYYEQYFKQAMMGGAIVSLGPVVCVGPVKYRGERLVQIDIDNVKAAAAAAGLPTSMYFCRRPSRPVSASTNITSPTKTISMRSRRRWRRNIARSWMPAFWCRSMIRSCRTFSLSSVAMTHKRSAAPPVDLFPVNASG